MERYFVELRMTSLMVLTLGLLADPACAGGFYSPNSDMEKYLWPTLTILTIQLRHFRVPGIEVPA